VVGGFEILQDTREVGLRYEHRPRQSPFGQGDPVIHREVERAPYPQDAEFTGNPRHRIQHRREQVGMFVSVKMAWLNARAENLSDLRGQFLIYIQITPDERLNQPGDARGKPALRIQNAAALHQNEMTADIERRRFMRQRDRMFECAAVRHERCCRENAVAVSFDNAFIDIACKAEIVCIDDESRAGHLEQDELDAQELLRVGMHIFDQSLHFTRRARQ
jgi:hypothetical protein